MIRLSCVVAMTIWQNFCPAIRRIDMFDKEQFETASIAFVVIVIIAIGIVASALSRLLPTFIDMF